MPDVDPEHDWKLSGVKGYDTYRCDVYRCERCGLYAYDPDRKEYNVKGRSCNEVIARKIQEG